jgi:Ulp1 family protease
MHNTFWLLDDRNDTERKNVFNKFKANKIDFFEYDIIFVPLHVNNNHW